MATKCVSARRMLISFALFTQIFTITNRGYAEQSSGDGATDTSGHLLANAGGLYKTLNDTGVDLSLIFKGDINRTLIGGVDRKTTQLANLDLKIGLDIDKLGGWSGASAFIYILANHGGHPSENAGDEMGTNNIETADKIAKVYELWVQQALIEGKFSVLLGVHDLNSEFYVTDSSGLFLNACLGVGTELATTGANGPSIFPIPAPAVRLKFEPLASIYLQAAAFDTENTDPKQPGKTDLRTSLNDGALLIAELAYHTEDNSTSRGRKVGVGYWSYSKAIAPASTSLAATESLNGQSSEKAKSNGVYVLYDQYVTEKATAFLRYGAAFGNASPVSSSASTGLVVSGPLPWRSKDRLGVAVARAHTSPTPARQRGDLRTKMSEFEMAHELTYRVELWPGVAIQPDIQYVVHAKEPQAPADAWVADMRLEVAF